MTDPLLFVFGVHLHQPVGNFDGFTGSARGIVAGAKDHASEHAAGLAQPITHARGKLAAIANFHPCGDK